jgi:glycosyltransferase involved in cell wall biosynthesis
MRIVIDARLLEHEKGGMYRIIFNMLRCISDNNDNNQYTLYFSNIIPELEFLRNNKFDCRVLKGPKVFRAWYTFATHVLLPLNLLFGKFELFYTPYYFGPIFNPVKKVILSPWDISFTTHPTHYTFRMGKQLSIYSRITCKKADALITCSEYDKDIIEDIYSINREKIFVLPLAVDQLFRDHSYEDEQESYLSNLDLNCKYILSVGTIYNRRNIDKLLIAFSRLIKNGNNIKLVLLGRNFTSPKLNLEELITDLGIADYVYRQERVTDKELKLLYLGAMYTYCTSTVDGETIIIKESLAVGTPVIINSLFSRTISGFGVILEDPENVDCIEGALVNALDNYQVNLDVAIQGQKYVLDITWEKSIRNLLSCIQSI